jgi:PBP1b-binding outer membrane lipoprotein LpoB
MSNKKFMTTILIVVIALSSLLVFAGCSKQAADDVSTNKSGDGKYAKKFTYTINTPLYNFLSCSIPE